MKHTTQDFMGMFIRLPAPSRNTLLPLLPLLFSFFLVSPAVAQTATPVTQFQLANGLTVIVKTDRRAPTAAHMLWVRVGSMDEVDGTTGVAHVLEHMMFKGTPSLKPGEFSRRVAALGGRENAFTSRDATGFYQQIPSGKLEDVMRLEADRFARNQWADEEFAKELEVVKEERRLRTEDSPRALMYEAANAMTFVASPYRRPVVGWMSDLEAMTPDDARAFYRRWYVPANAAVVIAGDVDVAQVRRLAEKYYGAAVARPVPPRKPRLEPVQTGLRRMDFKAPASQAYVSLSYKVPGLQSPANAAPATADAFNRDALALTVLAAVLDGYSGARLERALAQGDNRLADSAGASNGLFGRGPQVFVLDGVPAAGKTADQVAEALRQQVARIAREGVSEAELQRVKTQWVASETYKLDALFSQARGLGTYWVNGLPLDTDERLVSQLRSISSAEVQAVAARYFSDDQLTLANLLPQPPDPSRAKRVPAAGLRH
ncbi:pitrilysin family protein [Polaromonas sp.]|uniref:M16 family metallopeptidase n=1 Tax=Polaromonas sp. TaxID=1869339 RepID=UPI002486D26B|nr:pitrilysin family protein [Polaromonas sp.]MDI1339826.1 pitrilysin family protein [Polaromonas sp.]